MTKITLTHNGKEVCVGMTSKDTAKFWINDKRYFQEMEGFGVDVKVINRKSVASKKYIYFVVEGGKEYKLFMEDFLAHAWKYPKEGSQFADKFDPKLVISEKVAGELNEKRKIKDDEEWEMIKLRNL